MGDYIVERMTQADRDGHRFYAAISDAARRNLPLTEFLELADAACAWCTAQFGPPSLVVGCRWTGEISFWFRDEADAMVFKMRWS